MAEDIFEKLILIKEKEELAGLIAMNQKTGRFDLSLNEEQAKELILSRNNSLKKYERVELGSSILDKLIFTFCDSQYIWQDNYLETLEALQDIFYGFKNEAQDLLTDDELLTFMKEQFETVCCGDLDYLAGTCLERFAAVIRAGYMGHQKSGGKGEYKKLSTEAGWDAGLYWEALKDLFG